MSFRDLIGPGKFIDPAVIQASARSGSTRYPYAAWMPIPENYYQARITPTQFIYHSMAGPYLTTIEALHYYISRSDVTGESTFIADLGGRMAQVVEATVRADNNYKANARAGSIETQDNGYLSDPGIALTPWSDPLMAQLAGLSAWYHLRFGIPLKRCETWDGPGMDGHRAFKEWSIYTGKTCPGNARWAQIPDVLAAAKEIAAWTPTPEPDPDPAPPVQEFDTMIPAIAKTTDGAYQAQFEFHGPIYTVGETAAHDVTQAEVFGRGGGRAYNIVDRTIVSWASPENPGSWGAVKATKTVAQVRALMGST